MRPDSRSRVLLVLAAGCLAASLIVPWFTFRETWSDRSSSESWGLVWSSRCHTFQQEPIECRYELFDSGVQWLLVPTFQLTRFLALATALFLLITCAGGWLRLVPPRVISLVGSGALLVFAVHIGFLPGDMQYQELQPSFGALAGVAGALLAFLNDLPLRARVLLPLGGALLMLGSALWLPWITEVEAVFPSDPQEQSAYSYGTINSTHHWHAFRNSRQHYVEDAPTLLRLFRIRGREVIEHGPGIVAALAGLFLAGSLLARSRDFTGEKGRIASLRASAVVVIAGALMPFTIDVHGRAMPGSGAVAAAVVVLGVLLNTFRPSPISPPSPR
jgi:hypothetical protein